MAGVCLLVHVFSTKKKLQRDIAGLNTWIIQLHGRKLPIFPHLHLVIILIVTKDAG